MVVFRNELNGFYLYKHVSLWVRLEEYHELLYVGYS